MTKPESKSEPIAWKALLAENEDYLRTMVETIVQATLEAEMTEALGAEKGERTPMSEIADVVRKSQGTSPNRIRRGRVVLASWRTTPGL